MILFYENEIILLNELMFDIFIIMNFMVDILDLILYQGLDYSKFVKYVDVISWDVYLVWYNDWESIVDLVMKVGFINDLYWSLKQQFFLLMECMLSVVNWYNVNKVKCLGMNLLLFM